MARARFEYRRQRDRHRSPSRHDGDFSHAAESSTAKAAAVDAAQQDDPENWRVRLRWPYFRAFFHARWVAACVACGLRIRLFASAQTYRRDQPDDDQHADESRDAIPSMTGPDMAAVRTNHARTDVVREQIERGGLALCVPREPSDPAA